MYFEDWGYVVWSFAYNGAEKDELLKIMQNLSLEEDTDYVPETGASVFYPLAIIKMPF